MPPGIGFAATKAAPAVAKGIGALGKGLIGGIGNIVSGLFGNRSRKREAQRQREWTESMWNRQNAYNTPAMQMKRLKEAGLNPALMYGQGTTGNAEKALPYQQAQIQDVGANFAQSVAAGAQASIADSQQNLIDKQALLASAGAEKAGAEAKYTTDMLQYDIANKMADTEAKSVNAAIIGLRLEGMQKHKADVIKGIAAEFREKQSVEKLKQIDLQLREAGFHDKYTPTIIGGLLGFDLTNMDKQLMAPIKIGDFELSDGITQREAISAIAGALLAGNLTLHAAKQIKDLIPGGDIIEEGVSWMKGDTRYTEKRRRKL